MSRPVAALADSLRRYNGRLLRTLAKTRIAAGETEVHRLRVATRRARAVLRLAVEAPQAAAARRARKRLRRLGRVLGERRMWDVAIAGMAGLYPQSTEFEVAREAATNALVRELRRIDPAELGEDLRKSVKLLRRVPAGVYLARARSVRAGLGAALARPAVRADARHAVRIRVKKARYLLEATGMRAPAARRLQGLLGREHDLHLLQQLAGRNERVRALEQEARVAVDRAWARDLGATIAMLDRFTATLA